MILTKLNGPRLPVFAAGFRIFFLLAGTFALVALALWAAALAGRGPALGPLWHGHEMIFGYGGAVVAGFVLTAAARWTGRHTLRGLPLAALALLWVAARIAAASGPPSLAAVLSAGFFTFLAVGVARPIVAAGNRRNHVILLVLTVFAGLEILYWLAPWRRSATLVSALMLMLTLIALIGGRIIPLFTANAVPGLEVRPQRQLRDFFGVTALGALAVLVLVPQTPQWFYGAVASAAALAHAVRMRGWGSARTVRRPLLAVLHLAYACLPAGLALLAAQVFGAPLPGWVALHVLAIGAFGLMTLGMMTRVTLGHTGRLLRADRMTVAVYGLVAAALVVRTVGPFLSPQALEATLLWSAALWCAAFALFLIVYTPPLLAPRVDGGPG